MRVEAGEEHPLICRSFYFHHHSCVHDIQTFSLFRCAGAIASSLVLLGARFIYFYMVGDGDGHIQSIILSGILMTTGFLMSVIGLVADLISSKS